MTIEKLITGYLSAVEKCLVLFDHKFARRDLVRAWREGAIPQAGKLAEDIEYQMHGVGCSVEYADHNVDFDFASQHEVGFDAWRLWQYSTQFPDLYPHYQDREAIEAALAERLSGGSISPVEKKNLGEGNDKLLRVSEKSS